MSPAPQVSLIVPAYNAAGHVADAVQSALAQSLAEVEVVCVDDGSADNTVEVLSGLAAADNRVRVVRHERNRGASAARNTGLAEARGEFVFMLDADDWLPPRALEHLRTASRSTGCAIAIGKLLWTRSREEALRFRAPETAGEVTTTSLPESASLQSVSGSHCCNLYRRELIEANRIRYDVDLTYGEDQLFQATAIARAGRVAMLDEVVYVYRHYRGQSITRRPTSLRDLLSDLEFHRRIARLLQAEGVPEAGDDFMRNWPYSIKEYWVQIPDLLTPAEASDFFAAFRRLMAEFSLLPWNARTPSHHRRLLETVMAGNDDEAFRELSSGQFRMHPARDGQDHLPARPMR